jgi:hypothetical protein
VSMDQDDAARARVVEQGSTCEEVADEHDQEDEALAAHDDYADTVSRQPAPPHRVPVVGRSAVPVEVVLTALAARTVNRDRCRESPRLQDRGVVTVPPTTSQLSSYESSRASGNGQRGGRGSTLLARSDKSTAAGCHGPSPLCHSTGHHLPPLHLRTRSPAGARAVSRQS